MFRADYNHSSKSVRSELMNTPGRGILLHSPEKISRPRFPAVAQLVFSPASAEHPFPPVVQVCQRANKLQTAIIRIKKISPYDTERQTCQNYELHTFTSSYRIKKAVKVAGIALGLILCLGKALKRLVGVLFWAVLKPICRGVGWIISILTAAGIIYWVTTL